MYTKSMLAYDSEPLLGAATADVLAELLNLSVNAIMKSPV